VAWSIVLLEKTILRGGEHCQSRRKQVFFQDNLVRALIHASFTKTNLPDSSLLMHPQIITDPPPNVTVGARPGEAYKPQCLATTVTFGGGSVVNCKTGETDNFAVVS
jgi:hypothetical protein